MMPRLLQRALTAESSDTIGTPIALFKRLDSWRALSKTAAAQAANRFELERLTRRAGREIFRKLLDKGTPKMNETD